MSVIRAPQGLLVLLLSALTQLAGAQTAGDLQKQLETQFPLTKTTADSTDIVTAGAVLVLQQDNLQMDKIDQPIATHNYFKNGKVTQGGLLGVFNRLQNAGMTGAPSDATTMRKFVAGEKFWTG